jgi:hypothetical protein
MKRLLCVATIAFLFSITSVLAQQVSPPDAKAAKVAHTVIGTVLTEEGKMITGRAAIE